MDELKEYMLNKCVDLHVAIHYGTSYGNSEEGTYNKLQDIIRYEQLKELIRDNPCFDSQEMGAEVSLRVRKRTSL